MRTPLALLLATISLPLLALALPDSSATSVRNYDAIKYEIELSLDLKKQSFDGILKAALFMTESGRDIVLDAGEPLTISSVRLGDLSLPFEHTKNLLKVHLPQEVPARDSVAIVIYYNGVSKFSGEYDSGGIYFSSDEHAATIGEPYFARTWFPCNDAPSDKALVTMRITVDSKLTAVSNGVLTNTQRNGETTTYTWKTRYPIATYLVSFAVAPYNIIRDSYTGLHGDTMNLAYYVFPDDSEKAAQDFAGTSKILSYFARTFCEYPFMNEKFGYAETDGELTMENQTVCSIEPKFITGKKDYESTIVHETAHQWWGDLVTPMHWGDIWLSEGFATYAEALYRESAYSPESYRKYIAWLMGDVQGRLAGPVVSYEDTAFWSLFSARVYSKGALVLHMLRGVVGDSSFFTLMRNFLNDERFRYGNATTADFIQTSERAYGGSLKWFFDEWLFASADSLDRPEYTYSWSSRPEGTGFRVRLDLAQISAPRQLFHMPMNVAVSSGESQHMFRIDDSLATQSFTFDVGEQPTSVEIDKENYVMKILKRKEDN